MMKELEYAVYGQCESDSRHADGERNGANGISKMLESVRTETACNDENQRRPDNEIVPCIVVPVVEESGGKKRAPGHG